MILTEFCSDFRLRKSARKYKGVTNNYNLRCKKDYKEILFSVKRKDD